jgi:hypothetical protein
MVNKGDENIINSLFMKGTNKFSKETESKFLNYLWNNTRNQENTNQVIKNKNQCTPHPPTHSCKMSNMHSHTVLQGLHNTVLEI